MLESANREGKARELERLHRELTAVGVKPGMLNKARGFPAGLYRQGVPAFEALFEREGRDWQRFYGSRRSSRRCASPG